MKEMKEMTPIELREKGYQALVGSLGVVDAIRFLQQAGFGRGNYTQERQETLSQVTRVEFWQDLQAIRARNAKRNYRAEQ
jgi:hypothetical protein